MNWFVSDSVSADSMLQAGLPFVQLVCVLVGIVAALILLMVALYTIFAARSSDSHVEFPQFGEAKPRADRVPSTGAARGLGAASH